jgi:hypothetical protein
VMVSPFCAYAAEARNRMKIAHTQCLSVTETFVIFSNMLPP